MGSLSSRENRVLELITTASQDRSTKLDLSSQNLTELPESILSRTEAAPTTYIHLTSIEDIFYNESGKGRSS
jgi:hypothetical protein